MIQKAPGHTVRSCSQYSFEWRQIVSFLPPFHLRWRGAEFHFITCAHCNFFLCDAENYRLSVQLMCLDDRADWMVIFWWGKVRFDIVGHSTGLTIHSSHSSE